MNSQYMEDLYNYCCLKSKQGNRNINRNIRSDKYTKRINDILININKSYINKIKAGADYGNKYALIYKGEIPDNIINDLEQHLSKFFTNFKILIMLDIQSILDILIAEYNIYNIYIMWDKEINQTQHNSTNTENKDENEVEDENLTIGEEVDNLMNDNLIDEYEFIEEV